MPASLRKKLNDDPLYKSCIRNLYLDDHECGGDEATGRFIEWEHVFIFAGRQVQEEWSIIPICYRTHRGDLQNKEINEWIALNRATDEELRRYSKARNLMQRRGYLNTIYGGVT